MIQRWLDWLWYSKNPLSRLLWPLSLIYILVEKLHQSYQCKRAPAAKVPVIVVGNITVGGVGKTPLVVAIANALQERGYKIAIISRGYQAKTSVFPHEIQSTDSALAVGDEPKLLALNCQCPVVIDPKRTRAIDYLVSKYALDFIISDDGLQHAQMSRAIEIAVVDGLRIFGNGFCLPAGPLRESKKRLKKVDFVVVNSGQLEGGYQMTLIPQKIQNLATNRPISKELMQEKFAAVAAIGNPARFFNTLDALALDFVPYPFPDHYALTAKDLDFAQSNILMTEKDAVKCMAFARSNYYYLPVVAQLEQAFWDLFWNAITELKQ